MPPELSSILLCQGNGRLKRFEEIVSQATLDQNLSAMTHVPDCADALAPGAGMLSFPHRLFEIPTDRAWCGVITKRYFDKCDLPILGLVACEVPRNENHYHDSGGLVAG